MSSMKSTGHTDTHFLDLQLETVRAKKSQSIQNPQKEQTRSQLGSQFESQPTDEFRSLDALGLSRYSIRGCWDVETEFRREHWQILKYEGSIQSLSPLFGVGWSGGYRSAVTPSSTNLILAFTVPSGDLPRGVRYASLPMTSRMLRLWYKVAAATPHCTYYPHNELNAMEHRHRTHPRRDGGFRCAIYELPRIYSLRLMLLVAELVPMLVILLLQATSLNGELHYIGQVRLTGAADFIHLGYALHRPFYQGVILPVGLIQYIPMLAPTTEAPVMRDRISPSRLCPARRGINDAQLLIWASRRATRTQVLIMGLNTASSRVFYLVASRILNIRSLSKTDGLDDKQESQCYSLPLAWGRIGGAFGLSLSERGLVGKLKPQWTSRDLDFQVVAQAALMPMRVIRHLVFGLNRLRIWRRKNTNSIPQNLILPTEIWDIIFHELANTDLLRAAAVCRAFSTLCISIHLGRYNNSAESLASGKLSTFSPIIPRLQLSYRPEITQFICHFWSIGVYEYLISLRDLIKRSNTLREIILTFSVDVFSAYHFAQRTPYSQSDILRTLCIMLSTIAAKAPGPVFVAFPDGLFTCRAKDIASCRLDLFQFNSGMRPHALIERMGRAFRSIWPTYSWTPPAYPLTTDLQPKAIDEDSPVNVQHDNGPGPFRSYSIIIFNISYITSISLYRCDDIPPEQWTAMLPNLALPCLQEFIVTTDGIEPAVLGEFLVRHEELEKFEYCPWPPSGRTAFSPISPPIAHPSLAKIVTSGVENTNRVMESLSGRTP
ncbi:hypothetical protein FB451DRAFT_1164536 [Mycena latifolia]|nr:hypothetical protein FB451DRAFT_1164536 [Mycena latifolia]